MRSRTIKDIIEKSKTHSIKNLKNTIKDIQEVDKKYIWIVIISSIVFSIIPIVLLIIMQYIMNMIQLGNIDISILFISVIVYIIIEILEITLTSIQSYYTCKFKQKFNLNVKNKFMKKASSLSMSDYEKSNTQDIIQRANSEGDGKALEYFHIYLKIFRAMITLMIYVLIIGALEMWIVFAIISVPIIRYFSSRAFNKKRFKIVNDRTNDERKSIYWSFIITSGNNFKELKLYNLFDYFRNKYINKKTVFNTQDLAILKKENLKLTILSIIDTIIDGALLFHIVLQGFKGVMLLGNVMLYIKSVLRVKSGFDELMQLTAIIPKESLYLDRYYSFLAENNIQETSVKKEKIQNINEIRIVDLSYKYSGSEDYTLKNINLSIKSGSLFAIVGRNGSGKTTLGKIILGLYDNYEGEIYINDINLKQIDNKSYMDKVGALFQDFSMYEATIRENISYGNLDMIDNDKELLNIAKTFKIDYLIEENKNKLETQLGFWFDGGKQISIGEWQKIALARVFAKKSDLYVLDEPNAALDAISEFDLSNLYKTLLDNKIGVIIAHRFNNFINYADKIIVIDNGEIIQAGTHNELLNDNGLYSLLYNYQKL